MGLGTDAYTNDMLQSYRAALTVQRHQAGNPGVGWGESAAMLFRQNPAIASAAFGIPLGVLKQGAAADIVVMEYRPYTPLGADNADGHLYFGVTGRQCRTAVIGGVVRLQDGVLAGIDEEEMNADIMDTAGALWRALDAQHG